MTYELFHWLDLPTLYGLNQFAGVSGTFDRLVSNAVHVHLLKGGVVMAVLWWLWFRGAGPDQERTRQRLILTMAGGIAGVAIARTLAALLPMRLRPIHEPGIEFVLPLGMEATVLDGWSSFPSDHAVLFFALATGFWFVSRVAGAVTLAYAAVIICLPRIYLGLHYPTDILAGALVGIAVASAVQWLPLANRGAGTVLKLATHGQRRSTPASFCSLTRSRNCSTVPVNWVSSVCRS